MTGFVPIEKIETTYQLREGAIAEGCTYPNETNWQEFDGFRRILNQVSSDLEQGPVALVGGTGRGKTFHALLEGFRWRERPGRNRTAWFSSITRLTVEGAIHMWDTFRSTDQSLWIVDNIHLNDTLFSELLSEFKVMKMQRASHRLLCTAWATPQADIATIDVALTAIDIAQALEASKRIAPKSDVLERLASFGVGLRYILFGKYSENPELLLSEWRRQFDKNFSAAQRSILTLLAYLEVLDVETRWQFDSPSTLEEIRPLERKYIYRNAADETCRLIDTDFATFLIKLDLDVWSTRSTGADLAQRFFDRVVVLADEWKLIDVDLSFDLLSNTLEYGSDGIVTRFLGAAPTVHQASALWRLRNNSTFTAAVDAVFEAAPPFSKAVKILQLLGRSVPLVRDRAAKMIESNRGRIQHLLRETGDISAWSEGETLHFLTDDARLRETLLDAVKTWNVSFFTGRSPEQRNALLSRLRRLDPDRWKTLRHKLFPLFASELSECSALGFWKRLRTYSKDPLFLKDLLGTQSEARIADVVLRKPNSARYVLRSLLRQIPSLRQRVWRGLQNRYINSDQIEEWGHLHHLAALVDIANDFGGLPNLLQGENTVLAKVRAACAGDNLAIIYGIASGLARRTVSKEPFRVEFLSRLKESFRNEQDQKSLNERLHCLSLLPDNGAEDIVNKLLVERTPNFADPVNEFWFLWNSTCLLKGASKLVMLRTKRVVDDWENWSARSSNSVALLSLAGLCGDLLDTEPTFNISAGDQFLKYLPSISEMSPVALIYQLRALSVRDSISTDEHDLLIAIANFLIDPVVVVPRPVQNEPEDAVMLGELVQNSGENISQEVRHIARPDRFIRQWKKAPFWSQHYLLAVWNFAIQQLAKRRELRSLAFAMENGKWMRSTRNYLGEHSP